MVLDLLTEGLDDDYCSNPPSISELVPHRVASLVYTREMGHLTQWCEEDHIINTTKSMERIIDSWRTRVTPHTPLQTDDEAVEEVDEV